ncbi:MAG: phage tail spike protein [Acutalibacteraceae bacterium]
MIHLYDKNETDFTHNGICILKPLEAVVTEELNGDYSLKITMPRGNKEIEIEQIIKVPTQKSEQLFRVYNSDIDMLGNQVFYARHIFYDLLDYFIEDTRPSGSGALAISKILENTPFTGTSDITEQGTAYYQMMNPVKAILGADNAFIEVWGGELERDNFNVRMRNHLGTDRGVSIRYRKNLTVLRLQTDLSGVYTKIMPTGLKSNGQTLLKLPEKYISSPLIDNYVNTKTTRIHYSEIKIDEEISEAHALEMLRNAAAQEFENGLDKPQITATVEFIPLQDTEEYKDFAVLESVYLGDTVKIFHEDLNIELEAKVIEYEFDALSKRYNKVILGNANPKYGDTQKKYIEKQKEETTTALEQAIINATQLITGNQGGYIVTNPAEKPQEIFIMDTPDISTSQKVWRWNLSGLGYSSTGINGPFALAMTMDGAIVADFITAGTINGSLIKAGSVQAGSLSQEYKKSVTDAINSSANEVTQAFQVADGQVLSTVNNTLSNYSTTTQMNSAITQSANKISSDVSATYLSKTSASNTYATKTSLTQTADEINSEVSKKVNNSDFGTKITQNAYSVRVAWNNNSNYIQLEAGKLAIYNGSVSTSQKRAVFDESGNHFYRDNYYVGKIGTNQIKDDNSKKGLNFDLEYQGSYMTWAAKQSSTSDTYTMKWTYVQNGKGWSNYTENTLHAGCDIDMHYWTLKNVNFEGGGINGTLNMVQPLSVNSDGTLSQWSNGCSLQFKNGILVSGKWYN